MKKLVQIGAALAVAMPLAAFAMTGTGGGAFLGNVASAGYGETKVEVCHNGLTLTIGAPAVATHLAHGDTVGPCSGSNSRVDRISNTINTRTSNLIDRAGARF